MSDWNVPSGWRVESYCGRVVLVLDNVGAVTLDVEARGFRAGWALSGPMSSRGTYSGRGWKQRLVDDAVAYIAPRKP